MPSGSSTTHTTSDPHSDGRVHNFNRDFDAIHHRIGIPSLLRAPTGLHSSMSRSRSGSHSESFGQRPSCPWGSLDNSSLSADQFAVQQSGTTTADLYDASFMGDSFSSLPSRFSAVQQDFNAYQEVAYSFNSSSSPSLEADSDGGHSPPVYHLSHAAQDTTFHAGERYINSAQNSYDNTRQPFHGYPTPRSKGNTWEYSPSVPFISRSTRTRTMSSRSPTEPSYLLHTFAQSPDLGDSCRWPQMFKVNQAKKTSPKKQVLACLFCRERKIGCMRPPKDHPDQTCNQCVRRKRTCVYPSESRRGHHARNRMSARKFLGLDEPSDSAPTAESPPPE